MIYRMSDLRYHPWELEGSIGLLTLPKKWVADEWEGNWWRRVGPKELREVFNMVVLTVRVHSPCLLHKFLQVLLTALHFKMSSRSSLAKIRNASSGGKSFACL